MFNSSKYLKSYYLMAAICSVFWAGVIYFYAKNAVADIFSLYPMPPSKPSVGADFNMFIPIFSTFILLYKGIFIQNVN